MDSEGALPPDDLLENNAVTTGSVEQVVDILQQRFDHDEIYTGVSGRVLVAINPGVELDTLLSPGYKYAYANMMDAEQVESRLPPHPYDIAERAHRQMISTLRPQSILLAGESGSGKSYTARMIMDYLACTSTARLCIQQGQANEVDLYDAGLYPQSLEYRVQQARTLLDAFSSASTLFNGRSASRVGYFTQLFYDVHGGKGNVLSGCRLTDIGMEPARVWTRQEGEQTFKIFNALLHGASAQDLDMMLLSGRVRDYRMAANADTDDAEFINECAAYFHSWSRALDAFDLQNDRSDILKCLAALLHLGNVQFQQVNNVDAEIVPDSVDSLRNAAHLLGVDARGLQDYLLQPDFVVVDGEGMVALFDGRLHHLMELLYRRLFQFVIDAVNHCMAPADESHLWLGILDMPGNEMSVKNCFSQYMVNMSAELVHSMVTQPILEGEQDELEQDGIPWQRIEYRSTSECAALLCGQMLMHPTYQGSQADCINNLVEAECNQREPSAYSLLYQIQELFVDQTGEFFIPGRQEDYAFGVVHSFGDVVYEIDDFIERNQVATVTDGLRMIFDYRREGLMRELFQESDSAEAHGQITRFLLMMQVVQAHISLSDISVIFCVKPNVYMNPREFDGEYAAIQVNSSQLESIIDLYRSGYPIQMSFVEFFRRYDLIRHDRQTFNRRKAKGKKDFRNTISDMQAKCVDISQFALQSFEGGAGKLCQIGLSKIHLSTIAVSILDFKLKEKRDYWATEIQRVWRGHFDRLYVRECLGQSRKAPARNNSIQRPVLTPRSKNLKPKQPSVDGAIEVWSSNEHMDRFKNSAASAELERGVLGSMVPSDSAWDALDVNDMTLNVAQPEQAGSEQQWLENEAAVVIAWLEENLGCRPRSRDELVDGLMNLLADGSVLVSLARAFFPHIPTVTELRHSGANEESLILVFLNTAYELCAIDENYLFTIEELLHKTDPGRVVGTLILFKERVTANAIQGATPNLPKMLPTELLKTIRASVLNKPIDVTNLHGLNASRRKAIRDLLKSEQRYLLTLRLLNLTNGFLSSRKLIPLADIAPIFDSTDQIERYHYQSVYGPLCISLGFEDYNDLSVSPADAVIDQLRLGDIFLDVLVSSEDERPSMVQLYETYLRYVPDIRYILNQAAGGYQSRLGSFLNSFETHFEFGVGVSLSRLLLRPLDRMSEYAAHLMAIDEFTPSSHPDKELLTVVLSRLKRLTDELNQSRASLLQRSDEHNLADKTDLDRPALLDGELDFEALLQPEYNQPEPTLADTLPRKGSAGVEVASSRAATQNPGTSVDTRGSASHTLLYDVRRLETTWRKFICKGSVWEVINSNLVKERSLFLFNDIMIIAKEVQVSTTDPSLPSRSRFVLKSVLELKSMFLKASRNEDAHETILKTPVMAKAIARFENNPRKGVTYLIERGVLNATPASVASFLHRTPGLNRRQIGKFIGTRDNLDILTSYLDCFDFGSMRPDEAMRVFLSTFRLPGEPKTIDLILDKFAESYFKANSALVKSKALTTKLVFAILMLNADLHRRKNDETDSERYNSGPGTMTGRDFVSKFRAQDEEGQIPAEMLMTIYDSIYLEKLGVAAVQDEETAKKIAIKMTRLPFRMTIHERSSPIIVSIPKPDPNLVIKIFPHSGMRASPSALSFVESNQATFELVGDTLGRLGITFLKCGESSHYYSGPSLPQGKSCVIEPPFMKHVFQIKAKEVDPVSGKKVSYMFSVANESQRQNWCIQLDNVLQALGRNELIDLGLPLSSRNGAKILQDFAIDAEGAVVIPSNAVIE